MAARTDPANTELRPAGSFVAPPLRESFRGVGEAREPGISTRGGEADVAYHFEIPGSLATRAPRNDGCGAGIIGSARGVWALLCLARLTSDQLAKVPVRSLNRSSGRRRADGRRVDAGGGRHRRCGGCRGRRREDRLGPADDDTAGVVTSVDTLALRMCRRRAGRRTGWVQSCCTAGDTGSLRSPPRNSVRNIGSPGCCVATRSRSRRGRARPARRCARPGSSTDRPRCRPAPPRPAPCGAGGAPRPRPARSASPASSPPWCSARSDCRRPARRCGRCRCGRRRSTGWRRRRRETSRRRPAFGLSCAAVISLAAPPTPMKCAM